MAPAIGVSLRGGVSPGDLQRSALESLRNGVGLRVGPLIARPGVAGLQEVFLDVLSIDGDRRALVDQVLAAAVNHRSDDGPLGDFARTALELDEAFPGDPGSYKLGNRKGAVLVVYRGSRLGKSQSTAAIAQKHSP